jgi:predicted amidohydrolase
MKICISQTKPIKGDVSANIEAHIKFVELSLTLNAEAIFFPELSLTGYEPELANKLATNQNDNRLDIFQEISDKNNIIIGLGLPTVKESNIRISMVIFEPNKPRNTYSKQQLHSDEFPYFENGVGQVIIKTNDKNISPAICYESLQPTNSENAFKLGADVYLASVAKPVKGVEKAFDYYPSIAKKYAIPVLMSNCVGFCDNFLSVGKSAVWTKDGRLLGQLDDKTEGILLFDTETEEIVSRILTSDKANKKC